MNIRRAKEEIRDTIEAYLLKDENGGYVIPSIRQRPVLLIGPPGMGKTQIMGQISRECGIGLISYTITHHTKQGAVGLPFIEKGTYGDRECVVTEYTMSEIVAPIYDRMEETGLKEGILLIDEINYVSETLAPTMLQFLQYKTFRSHKISEGWAIAATGNPPKHSKSVGEFDVVVLDRIKQIDVEPNSGVQEEYVYAENIHPAIISHLDIKGQNFCQIEAVVDGKLFTTPRAWEDLSQLILIYKGLNKKADRDVISRYIQYPRIAKDFTNYLELYYKYQNEYQMGEILQDVIREALCGRAARTPFDERPNVTCLTLSKLTEGSKELWNKNAFMKLLIEQLRSCCQGMAGRAKAPAIPGKSEAPAMILASLAQELERERFRRKKNGPSGKREDRL